VKSLKVFAEYDYRKRSRYSTFRCNCSEVSVVSN